MPNAIRIAIANQKGGVGKTTTTMNLAAAKAKQGSMTLMIDLDPQYCLTESCAMEPDKLQGGNCCDLFSKKTDLLKCCYNVESTKMDNLFIVPATQELAVLGKKLFTSKAQLGTFKENVEALSKIFDYIFFDCPPQLDELLSSALLSSHKVIIPIKPERLPYKGLELIKGTISAFQSDANPNLELTGVLVNMYRKNTVEHNKYLTKLREEENVLGVVPLSTMVTKEIEFGRPCTVAHPTSAAAKAFIEVTNKI